MPARKPESPDRLSAYRAKRLAGRTPEPFGGTTSAGNLFVVQQHAARRTHYDFRLEMNGVLVSWAVPRGPSPNPEDKRLAVHTEDHPVEYGHFEGIIPEGNYGAGAVILWDQGVWIPLEDPDKGMESGKLLFELRGYKLHGRWTLVRTKQDWLLIKERDGYASKGSTDSLPQDSIFSGRTVEQLRDGYDKGQPIIERLEELGVHQNSVRPSTVKVMLAESRTKPFTDPNWVFEIKYDGYRLVAGRQDGRAALISRNGHDLTATFPEVARAIDALPYDDFVMDGEVVVHDESGLPSFQRLQKRGLLSNRIEITRASMELPASLYLFDLIGFAVYDLRSLPLEERKELLKATLPTMGPLRFSDHICEQGTAMFDQVSKMRLEGIIAKRAGSKYVSGRSSNWLKIRADQSDDFVVVGFSEPKRGRGGFGALHVAQHVDGELVYCGRVGTGFSAQELDEIREHLNGLLRDEPACKGELPKSDEHHWVDPVLVCEVRFRELTEINMLRHPSFVRWRDDKKPEECVRQEPHGQIAEPVRVVDRIQERTVPFTNLDKTFWPDEGYTKGDLIEYYRAVSLWLLPYLEDRPVVMTRYPDGIKGKSFYQKDAPKFAPNWIRRVTLWSEGSKRELDYFVAENEESLLYIANMGTIPLHIWSSRVSKLEHPDWCILDLDPKKAPFSDVITIAQAVHDLCDEIQLPSFVKTSGSSGIHVLVPLAQRFTYEQSRTLGQLLARVIAADLPDIATVTRNPAKRQGKVYIDYVQNGHGRLLVSPFCVRPIAGAPVSATLEWHEVNSSLSIMDYTIRNVPDRMKRVKNDPFIGVLKEDPDLERALALLMARFE